MSADAAAPISRSITIATKREPRPRQRQRELHAFRREDLPAVLILHRTDMMMTTPERFVAEREPRPGASSTPRCGGPATARSSSAPTACGGSASSTARPRPTSRSRAGASPATRWSGGSKPWCCAGARRSTGASGRRQSLWHVPLARLLGPAGRAAVADARRLGAAAGAGACSGALWGLVDAPAAAGLMPGATSSRPRTRPSRAATTTPRRRPPSPSRSCSTTSR